MYSDLFLAVCAALVLKRIRSCCCASLCPPVQVISYTKGTINEGSPQFRGRVGFLKAMPSSDVSLYINNTRESDSGRYVCQIIIPSVIANPAEVFLEVKGEEKVLNV